MKLFQSCQYLISPLLLPALLFSFKSYSQILPVTPDKTVNAWSLVISYAPSCNAMVDYNSTKLQVNVNNHWPLTISWDDNLGHTGNLTMNQAIADPWPVIDDVILVNYNQQNNFVAAIFIGRNLYYNGVAGNADVVTWTAVWDGTTFVFAPGYRILYTYHQLYWYHEYYYRNRATIDDDTRSKFCVVFPSESGLFSARAEIDPTQTNNGYYNLISPVTQIVPSQVYYPDISVCKDPALESNLDDGVLITYIKRTQTPTDHSDRLYFSKIAFDQNASYSPYLSFTPTLVNEFDNYEYELRSAKNNYSERYISIAYDARNDIQEKVDVYLSTKITPVAITDVSSPITTTLLSNISDFNICTGYETYSPLNGFPVISASFPSQPGGYYDKQITVAWHVLDCSNHYCSLDFCYVAIARKYLVRMGTYNDYLDPYYYLLSSDFSNNQLWPSIANTTRSGINYYQNSSLSYLLGSYGWDNSTQNFIAKTYYKLSPNTNFSDPVRTGLAHPANPSGSRLLGGHTPDIFSKNMCNYPNVIKIPGFCRDSSIKTKKIIIPTVEQASLSPNPASSEIMVAKHLTGKNYTLQILNMQGNLLKTARIQNGTLNISELRSGSYLFVIKDEKWNIKYRQIIIVIK